MRSRKIDTEDDAAPTLGGRLIAALLAPVVLNGSILLMIAASFKRSRFLDHVLLSPAAYASAGFCFFMLVGVPALIGFMLGADRGLALLSHLFFINPAPERSLKKTALAWGSLLSIAYLLTLLFDYLA